MRRPRFIWRSRHTHMLICSSTLLAAARLLATAAVLAIGQPAAAQELMTRYGYENRVDIDLAAIFEPKWDVMVPMRDGVRLHTEIYIPRNQTEPLPIMLERTPYYANPQEQEYSIRLDWYEEFFDEGYIFVLQDLRGRYDSEGDFLTLRPNRLPEDVDGTDESTDFYDTIDWLVNNVPGNNGRVGTWGISYGGFLSTRAMVDPHPALAAVSPQATCADMFIGDDFHHNGAFRLSYAYEAAERFELPPELWPPEGAWDKYTRYLEMGPLSRVNPERLHGRSRMWNDFVEHPNMDEYWETEMCGVFPYLQGVTVPALHVTGWYDAEDFYGPIEVYKQLEADDENNENFLVLGPWRHGGWTFEEVGRMVIDIDLGSATARYFRDEIHAPWFAYWLKDKGSLPTAEVITFQTGSNEWKQYDSWPAEGMVPRNVYLRADGVVSFDPPPASDGDAYDEYVSDPDNPVPFQYRPIHYDRWHLWQAEDQRFVDGRPDVLTWESEPFEEEFSITGDIVAHLYASTSGGGADWIVKLIDVYPDDHPNPALRGYQYMVAGEVFRARFRNSYREPEPVVPNEVTPYTISLRDRDHRFLAGHRIMVQVQSTWFPIIDRNPQTWVPNIFEAVEEDFAKGDEKGVPLGGASHAHHASGESGGVGPRAERRPAPAALREALLQVLSVRTVYMIGACSPSHGVPLRRTLNVPLQGYALWEQGAGQERIARRLGFSDASSWSRFVKNLTGKTPHSAPASAAERLGYRGPAAGVSRPASVTGGRKRRFPRWKAGYCQTLAGLEHGGPAARGHRLLG